MNVVLATVGSRGDIQPLLVLGAELLRRGHAVRLAAPPNFAPEAAREGLAFLPIGSDTAALIEEHRELAERHPVVVLPRQIAIVRRELERQLVDLLAWREPTDVVVAGGLAFAASTLAERLGAAYVYLSFSVAGMRSRAHPPAPLPIFGLPSWGNAALWGLLAEAFDRALVGVLTRERRAVGLARTAPWRSIHGSRTLLAQDAIMGAVPADAEAFFARVPALIRSTPIAPLPAELERFLAGRSPVEPIVYLGFGSMPSADRERLFDCASELGRLAQARVVLASTYGASGFGGRDARVLCIGDADHRALFPRVDFVVHHGGAGTTASALRAGKPQLLVPHVHDQFAHGRRIAELGLGPAPIPRGNLDALVLARAVAEREKYRERAREVASELAGDNGAAPAADLLERLLDGAASRK